MINIPHLLSGLLFARPARAQGYETAFLQPAEVLCGVMEAVRMVYPEAGDVSLTYKVEY